MSDKFMNSLSYLNFPLNIFSPIIRCSFMIHHAFKKKKKKRNDSYTIKLIIARGKYLTLTIKYMNVFCTL